MAGPAQRFTRTELSVVATAAALVFTRVFGLSLVLPGMRAFGLTLTPSLVLVGTAVGAYGLTMALMQFPLGALSDRWGRRRVLVLATGLFVAGSVWAALAPGIAQLIAARLLQGTGAVAGAALAAVGETVPASRRTTAMALVGIPAGAGFLLGFAAGPVLEPHVGMRGLFWLTAALGTLAALPLLRPLPPAAPPTPPAPIAARQQTAALAAAGFTLNYSLITVLFFLPAVGPWTMAAVLLFVLVALGGVTRAVERGGLAGPALLGGLAALVVGAVAFVLWGGAAAVAAAGLYFLAHATLSSVIPGEVSRISGRLGGRGHGIQAVVAYAGTFAAGPVAGALAGSPAVALGILAALAALSGSLAARAGLLARPRPQPS